MEDFQFKTTPYQHQLDAWKLSKDLESFALFMDMGCISGDAEIQLNWFGSEIRTTLRDLYQRDPEPRRKIRSRRNISSRSLIDGTFTLNQVLGIRNSREKEVLRLTLRSRKTLTLTPDHEVMTTSGWVAAQDLTTQHYVLTNISKKEWDPTNPVPDRVLSVESAGRQDTYDLAMRSPGNNFIANGIVVHNCGKSKVLIDTSAHLWREGKINGHVVIAPRGCYLNYLESEIPAHMPDFVKHAEAAWSSYAKKKEKVALDELFNVPGDHLRTMVVNVEAMVSDRAIETVAAFLKKYRCMITVDESTTIKNPNSKRTKVLTNLGKFAEYRRIATGNPIPNGPLDLYSQAEFLRKNMLGFNNYFAYRNRFAVMQDQRFGNRAFKSVVGYRDLNELQRLMRKFAFIIKKEECLDLPPKVYEVMDVEMNAAQAKAYNEMLQDSYVQLCSGQVTAPMVLTQLLRLHQISCGFMQPDGMDPVPFGEPNDRIDQLIDVLAQHAGKAIIWATYRYNIQQIVAAVSAKFGANTVVHYYGDTTNDERTYARSSFQDPDSPVRFIVANPASGKFGNTWTAANLVVYFSNSYDLENRQQSEDRCHRIGQTKSVTYIDFRVRGTVDDKIYRVLKNKKKLTDEIIVGNWTWLLGEQAA